MCQIGCEHCGACLIPPDLRGRFVEGGFRCPRCERISESLDVVGLGSRATAGHVKAAATYIEWKHKRVSRRWAHAAIVAANWRDERKGRVVHRPAATVFADVAPMTPDDSITDPGRIAVEEDGTLVLVDCLGALADRVKRLGAEWPVWLVDLDLGERQLATYNGSAPYWTIHERKPLAA